MTYVLDRARSAEQLEEMLRAGDDCVFCEPMIMETQQVEHRTEHWWVIQNKYPKRGAVIHLLLVPVKHVLSVMEFGFQEDVLMDYWRAYRWAHGTLGHGHHATVARNGHPIYTGGSIEHFHEHIIVGKPGAQTLSGRPRQPITFNVGFAERGPTG